jgi:hypothetical protein
MKVRYWFLILYFVFPRQLYGDRKDIGSLAKKMWYKSLINQRKTAIKEKSE